MDDSSILVIIRNQCCMHLSISVKPLKVTHHTYTRGLTDLKINNFLFILGESGRVVKSDIL